MSSSSRSSPNTTMAFTSATPLKPPHPFPHPQICTKNPTNPQIKVSTTTLAQASTNLSPALQNLITQQKLHPIFSPDLLSPPLSSTLSNLQSQTPPNFHRPTPESPATTVCTLLADYHPRAITAARREILLRYPGIDAPGGKLYPAFRAAACWRDLREFTRVVGYYIVARDGFSDRGFNVMKNVYEQMLVPLDAMKFGVECLRDEFVVMCQEETEKQIVREGFDTLLALLGF